MARQPGEPRGSRFRTLILALRGRAGLTQLELLSRWIVDDACQVVAVLGLGGIGKTALAARLAQTVAPQIEGLFWRSLRNALPFDEWLTSALFFLGAEATAPTDGEEARLR